MFSADIYKPTCINELAQGLKIMLGKNKVVVLCVGCDKVVGDCLGPLVGSKLVDQMTNDVLVYGMMENNVNAKNLLLAKDLIARLHGERTLLVIDAALGDETEVGTVQIYARGLRPGSATNKNLPSVGDISIMGVVNQLTLNEMATLHSTKMNLVSLMSDVITKSLLCAVGDGKS